MILDPHHELVLLDGADGPDRKRAVVGGGEMIAFTCRSPDKETDNEDTVAVLPFGPEAAILVVADGAGGLPAGKRASRTAVLSLIASMQLALEHTMLLRNAILNGIEAANEAVLALANGSATTLTVVTVEGRSARAYQIGDSEALIVGQRGRIKLQTTPHSPTGLAVEAGFLDEREALHHEERHLVSNLLGTSDMRIDIGATLDLQPRDTIILASDGLTDNLHLDEIVERVRKGPLNEAADDLIGLAVERMSRRTDGAPHKPDDLSLILYRKQNLKDP